MNPITQVARFLVGGLFIFSGLVKLNDPVGTAIKLEEYFNVFATDFAPFFAYLVPAALFFSVFLSVLEVVLGVAVLLWYRMQTTAWVLLALIVFFTFLTFYSAYFNKVTDCGCFGDFIVLTPWQSFTKDIILLLFIAVIFIYRQRSIAIPFRTSSVMVGAVAAVSVLIGVYAIQHLPYFDFRPYEVGANLPSLMQPSAPLQYKYIMTKDGETHEFTKYPTDKSYEFKDMVTLNPEAQAKITDYSVWNDEGDFTDATFQGNKLLIVMYDVQKVDPASLTDIKTLVDNLPATVEPMVLTASGEAIYDEFRHEHQLAVPYYFGDATVLKTMIRSNPGLLLLQDGVVRGKWHFRDTPKADEITQLLGQVALR